MSMSNEQTGSRLSATPTGNDPEPSLEQISLHDSLYLENGNIVLLSLPRDNIVTAFKVHKEYLIQNSRVFEGMLAMPSLQDVEKYDSIPLLRLHDDAAELAPFLGAMYNPMEIPSTRDFYFSFNKVESLFKICKKYQADKLLGCMQSTLSAIWPKDLRSWDNIMKNGKEYTGFLLNEYILDSALPEPCFAIRLSRNYDVPEILPAAFYYLLHISPQAFSQRECLDGEHWGVPHGPEAKFTYLSRDDFMCFVQGSYAIRDFIRCLHEPNPIPGDGCKGGDTCFHACQLLAKKHKDEAAYLDCDGLQLLQARRIKLSLNSVRGICSACSARYTKLMMEHRSELWDSLPNFFGLDD